MPETRRFAERCWSPTLGGFGELAYRYYLDAVNLDQATYWCAGKGGRPRRTTRSSDGSQINARHPRPPKFPAHDSTAQALLDAKRPGTRARPGDPAGPPVASAPISAVYSIGLTLASMKAISSESSPSLA
jgi:hypothetical protein